MAKQRLSIDDVLGTTEAPITTFEEADKKALENTAVINKGGAPLKGKSYVTHKLAFHVDDETYEWLQRQTVKAEGMPAKERTANAVAKKIVMGQFWLNNL